MFRGAPVNNIPDYILEKLNVLGEGETSEPFSVGERLFSIVSLQKRVGEQEITPGGSWLELEMYAKNHKLNSFFSSWVEKRKPFVYIKYY